MRTQSLAEKRDYDARIDALLDEIARQQKVLSDLRTENEMLRMLVPGSNRVATVLLPD